MRQLTIKEKQNGELAVRSMSDKAVKAREAVNDRRKQSILQNMSYLLDARAYLLANNKSLAAQKEIRDNRRYDGYCIEIESPQIGGTDADWIRLYYSDVYLFLHDDGEEQYQLDPSASYGGELIDVWSYEDFVEELKNIDYDLEEHYT